MPCPLGRFRSPSPDVRTPGSCSLERCRRLRRTVRMTARSLHRPPAASRTRPRTLRSAAHAARAPSMGFRHCPLRDIGQRRPLVTGAPTLRPDGPTPAFRTPSSVCSVPGLAGLFHPATAYRVSLQGFVPRREPYRVSTALALVPFGAFPTASHLSVQRAAGCSCGFRALLSRRVR